MMLMLMFWKKCCATFTMDRLDKIEGINKAFEYDYIQAYTIPREIAQELLFLADKYALDGLKVC